MLDLNDLDEWSHADVLLALNDIEDGLNERELEWIERLGQSYTLKGALTTKQREILEDILKRANMRGLCD